MEYPYKVEYLICPRIKDNGISPVDGLTLAKDLEALIIDYVSKGYRLFETKTITSIGPANLSDTAGLIVIFKTKEQ